MIRASVALKFIIPNGAAVHAGTLSLENGCFGHIIVPPGSALIGKTFNVYAADSFLTSPFTETKLLANDKTFVVGANAFTAEEITQVGAARDVKIIIGSNVNADSPAILYWKA